MSAAVAALACAAAAIVLIGRPRQVPDPPIEPRPGTTDVTGGAGRTAVGGTGVGRTAVGGTRTSGTSTGGTSTGGTSTGGTSTGGTGSAGPEWAGWRLAAVSGALGLAVCLVVGGIAGGVAGIGAAIGAHRGVRKLEPAHRRRAREERLVQLPLVLDLLAVCLRAGMPLVGAVEAVAEVHDGPFRRDLTTVAGLLRLGSSPAAAWAALADDPDLAPVARAAGRSAESGSKLAGSFERLAGERRAALAAAGETAARKAGVVAMAPLGLCFLPAFVCLGLVPIVLSLAKAVLP